MNQQLILKKENDPSLLSTIIFSNWIVSLNHSPADNI
jgi:hypothetical protein